MLIVLFILLLEMKTTRLSSIILILVMFVYLIFIPTNFKILFSDPKSTAQKISYENVIPNEDNFWSIMVTVSSGFNDMFENWWYHYKKLNLTIPVYVVAEDSLTVTKYRDNTDFILLECDNNYIEGTKAFSYETKTYKKLVSKRPAHMLRKISLGYNLIYTDIDTVWMKDPRPFLTGNHDLWASLDGKSYYCTGFIACKASSKTISFLKKWNNTLSKSNQLNQPLFNKLIHNSSISHSPLSSRLFPSGNLYFKGNKSNTDVVVIHNNYIIGHDQKVKRFKKYGLWNKE